MGIAHFRLQHQPNPAHNPQITVRAADIQSHSPQKNEVEKRKENQKGPLHALKQETTLISRRCKCSSSSSRGSVAAAPQKEKKVKDEEKKASRTPPVQ